MAKDKENEKKLNEFEIDDLVLSIYNQIATWHNEDSSSPGLKHLTFDIINEVSGAVFNHLEIPYSGEVKIDDDAKKDALKKKAEISGKKED
jgi:hypothetical protein